MLLRWRQGEPLHQIASAWQPGERPWNACGTKPTTFKPGDVFWNVSPRSVESEMCKCCLRASEKETKQ